jgi:hypothetical protein
MSLKFSREDRQRLHEIMQYLKQHDVDIKRLWKRTSDYPQTVGGIGSGTPTGAPNPPDEQAGTGGGAGSFPSGFNTGGGTNTVGSPNTGGTNTMGSPATGGTNTAASVNTGGTINTGGTVNTFGSPPSGGTINSSGHSGASGSYVTGSGFGPLCGCDAVISRLYVRNLLTNALVATMLYDDMANMWIAVGWEFSCTAGPLWQLSAGGVENGTSAVACFGTLATYAGGVFSGHDNGLKVTDT